MSTKAGLQIRVYIGPSGPLYRILAALPAGERGKALARLAEASPTDPLASATDRLAIETARVAQALADIVATMPRVVPSAPNDVVSALEPSVTPEAVTSGTVPATQATLREDADDVPPNPKQEKMLAATDDDRWG